MCRKGAWIEQTVKVTPVGVKQSRTHGLKINKKLQYSAEDDTFTGIDSAEFFCFIILDSGVKSLYGD